MKKSALIGGGISLLLLISPTLNHLAAQAEQQLWRWVDSQGSFCLWYLSDPTIAAEVAAPSAILRTAARSSDLHPVLKRIIQDEPRFGDWVPGVVCVGRFGTVAADGQPAGIMEDERPLLISMTALAVEDALGQGADWQMLEIGLDAGHLDRVSEEARIATEDRELRVRQGLEGEDVQWELELDGLRLIWQGRELADSSVGTTRIMSFGYVGTRNSLWKVDIQARPTIEMRQLGSLRIEGNTPLAEALKSSPIRAMGAIQYGGDMTLSFTRDIPNID